jgi:CheY-like chemotaxis protein
VLIVNQNEGGGLPHRIPLARDWDNQQARMQLGKPCVWMVEDNAGDVFLMREAFREHGVECDVTVVADGEHAIRLVDEMDRDETQRCPQLILLDINLPKKSGLEVLQRVRRSSRCADVDVLVVTSSAASGDIAKNERFGATAYFRKPNSLDAFLKLGGVVRDLLQKHN